MPKVADSLQSKLARLDKTVLVSLMTRYAKATPAFQEFLDLQIGPSGSSGPSIMHFKQKIDEVLGDEDLGPFLSFEQERRIDRLIESIGDLVDNGRAADALELVEHSFNYVQNIAESVQEPDDMVTRCFDELIEIHVKACEAADVDRHALAGRLKTLKDNDDYGAFLDLDKQYAKILSPADLRLLK